jgi:hypothetical protein
MKQEPVDHRRTGVGLAVVLLARCSNDPQNETTVCETEGRQ